MAATKTKPKPTATKAVKAAPVKPKAAKASTKAAVKPAPATKKLEVGTFARFGGYRANVDKDEVVFAEGEILFITAVNDEGEDGVLYDAIRASDVSEYQANGDENIEGGQVSPSEVAELKGNALETARETYMPIRLVGRMADVFEENEDDAIAAAIELTQHIQETYFYLGGALARVLQEGKYLKENGGEYSGEEAFNDFCQAEFGWKASKSRQLARVYMTFSQIEGFDPATLDSVGWSKAAIAERFVTEENVAEVLELAETTSQRDLAFTLKEKFVKENQTASGKAASRASIKKTTMTFRFEEESGETVKLAIQSFMKQNGVQSEELALEGICVAWAQEHVEAETAKKRIAVKAKKAATAREKAGADAAAAPAKVKAAPAKKAA